MFLLLRLLSGDRSSAGFVLATATFAIGLGIGATIGPVTASRSHNDAPPPAPSAAREYSVARASHPVEVLRVVDGDTFEARVNLWPGLDITTRVRLRGIDAPEMKGRCGEERNKAEAAREALRAILDQGEVGIAQVSLDKYGGRVLASASTRTTPDVSAALLGAGMGRPYSGGQRDGWCR
jgi:endonuclease YncB( thermonuclease family)